MFNQVDRFVLNFLLRSSASGFREVVPLGLPWEAYFQVFLPEISMSHFVFARTFRWLVNFPNRGDAKYPYKIFGISVLINHFPRRLIFPLYGNSTKSNNLLKKFNSLKIQYQDSRELYDFVLAKDGCWFEIEWADSHSHTFQWNTCMVHLNWSRIGIYVCACFEYIKLKLYSFGYFQSVNVSLKSFQFINIIPNTVFFPY